jgi:hypothetical protein
MMKKGNTVVPQQHTPVTGQVFWHTIADLPVAEFHVSAVSDA